MSVMSLLDLRLDLKTQKIPIKLPSKFRGIFKPYRYKVFYGGRGSGKSWSVAMALIILSCNQKKLILCTREIQKSISDSVYRLLVDSIERLGLEGYFNITQSEITNTVTGSRFIFTGLYRNQTKLKSLEGVDIVWVEEGESTSQESLDILLPTIRNKGSEVWISFNPHSSEDPIYKMFIVNKRPDSLVIKVNHGDNPWFPDVLKAEMEFDKENNPEKYHWVWGGNVRTITEAQIFTGHYVIRSFESPESEDYLVGMDFGFAKDPTAIIRGFIKDNVLYLDRESYSFGSTYESLPGLIDKIVPSKRWPITADSARPDTIDYINRKGYRISGAKKGKNSIIDGIERLKGFTTIVVHPSLTHTIEEFRLYSYKVNKHTGDILPEPEDKNNHIIDSLRYATEKINPKTSFISWSDM